MPAPLAVDAERRWLALADFGADLQPVERHTARSPASWLRKVLAGLRQVGRAHR